VLTRAEELSRRFAEPVSGPAYRRVTRIAAAAVGVLLVLFGLRVLGSLTEMPIETAIGLVMMAGAPLAALPGILTGKTRIDATGIRQDGLFVKEVKWSEITRVRFARLPLSPRLIVTTGFGRFRAFYSGDKALDRAFSEVELALTGRGPK